ncbi:MAG: nickel pincer cofactor biosynthesis protein LarC [Desulfobacterales bacterium]|nr:nickel pincer cofactor biosynthesis protein LarC [Desulfobacterales bacterium]
MTSKHAYFDCFAGISGDMILGALIDLGAPVARLRDDLAKLSIGSFDLAVDTVSINGIKACQVTIDAPDSQVERHFSDIRAMIEGSHLSTDIKARAIATFARLAAAEAEIHDCSPDDVHFHEVGAKDAIIDIVGAALCLDYLGVHHITASPLPMGSGFGECRHGVLPLPAPATLALLKNVPVRGVEIEGELVTPTGAALITEMAAAFGPYPAMALQSVGYGAGRKRFKDHPNLLRVVLGQPAHLAAPGMIEDNVDVLETAVDDLNPEVYGHLMERLFESGVLDVYWIPVQMKKNRPGTLVQVICPPERVPAALTVIFNETSSLGVRIQPVRRMVLRREERILTTSMGDLKVKCVLTPDGRERLIPEYDECRRLAREHGRPLTDIYALVQREASTVLAQASRTALKPDAAIDKNGRGI